MFKGPVKTTGSCWVSVSARLHYAGPDGQGSGSPFGNLAETDVTDLRGLVLVAKRCCAGTLSYLPLKKSRPR
jgi:hypothetical protein